MECPRREELREKALDALYHLNRLTNEQIESLRNRNLVRLYELDKEIELTFGAKERAFGALAEHAGEHGC